MAGRGIWRDWVTKIEVLDALCGTGKTHAIIGWMHNNPTKRYMYVSPLISEIEDRVVPDCSELGFMCPEASQTRSKGEHLLELLSEGHNIAFTHNLYTRLTKEHLQAVKDQGYTMIIDEEVSMIEPLESSEYGGTGYTNNDLKYLYNDGKVKVLPEEYGRVVWNWESYGTKAQYSRLKSMCDMGMLYCADFKKDRKTGDRIDEIHSLVTQLPLELLECCERVILLSYLFSGSIMDSFLRLRGVNIEPFDREAEGVKLQYTDEYIKRKIKPRIKMIETPTTKKVGRKQLTYTWYSKEFGKEEADLISAAIRSVGRTVGATKEDMMWTAPKDRAFGNKINKHYIKPRGYPAQTCFVYCSARATNDYAKRHTLVHALYRHPNLTVEKYLAHYGIDVDTDNFAVAELVQWIWRSRIRNAEAGNINLCILSRRMNILFQDWLDKNNENDQTPEA